MAENSERIVYCKVPQCKVCRNKQLDTNINFSSNLSNKDFSVNFHQTCKTNLIIYLISCKNPDCSLKYVGRTHNAMNRRLSLHRANILAGTEGPAMLQHFTKVHQPSDMIIKAIEICSKSEIKSKEAFWIRELNTAFPYGLNDRVCAPAFRDAYKYTLENNSVNVPVYSIFNKEPSRRTKRGSGVNKRNSLVSDNDFDPDGFLVGLSRPDVPQYDYINFLRSQIFQLRKIHIKTLFLHLCKCIKDKNQQFHQYNSNIHTTYFSYLARDLVFFKLKCFYANFQSKVKPNNFLIIDFCNPFVDNINLNKIIKDKEVMTMFPQVDDNDKHLLTPTITYRYSQTIRSKITNYKRAIMQDDIPTQCDCSKYDNQFKSSSHVFTGKLEIIKNSTN